MKELIEIFEDHAGRPMMEDGDGIVLLVRRAGEDGTALYAQGMIGEPAVVDLMLARLVAHRMEDQPTMMKAAILRAIFESAKTIDAVHEAKKGEPN